jgi:Leucine-rich repeat (LRR) protein
MEIKGEFLTVLRTSTKTSYYGCKITEAMITKEETEIKAIIGDHLQGKTNLYVCYLWLQNSVIQYLPHGFQKIFPNLKVLHVKNCGLKKITRKELEGFENLETFTLAHNQLRSLPSDLFTEMSKLKNIYVNEDKLKFLSSQILAPIAENQLERVYFNNALEIDAMYQPGTEECVASLQELMDVIDKHFDLPFNDDEKEEFNQTCIATFENLWTSGQYSDLTIIGGPIILKEFHVHKNVLAAQSSVFAVLFSDGRNGMKITEFTTEAVEQFLRFMYTGTLKKCNVQEVFAIASKFEVKLLIERTEKIIAENVNESNAMEVFNLGHLHNSDVMKRAAFRQIEKMFPERMLEYELLGKPEDLRQLIEIHRKAQKVNAELDATLKKFEKVIE